MLKSWKLKSAFVRLAIASAIGAWLCICQSNVSSWDLKVEMSKVSGYLLQLFANKHDNVCICFSRDRGRVEKTGAEFLGLLPIVLGVITPKHTVVFPLEECLHLVVHEHFSISFPEYIVSEYVESQSSFLLFWWTCGKTNICQLRNAQHERCMLSFIWGKVRSTVLPTASQLWEIAPNRSGEGINIYGFNERRVDAIKHLSLQKFSASHEEQMSA